MQEIIVIEEMKDLQFHEVTRMDCEDEILRFNAPVMGCGTTAFIPLVENATLVFLEGTPDQPFSLRYSQYFQNKIMISLMMHGSSTHELGTGVSQPLMQDQSFIYATQHDRSYITYPAKKRFEVASLIFDIEFFETCLDRFFSEEEYEKKELIKASIFRGTTPGDIFDIIQDVRIIIKQILKCRLQKNFRRVFLECKLFELLAHYLQAITGENEKEITFSHIEITKLQSIRKALSSDELKEVSIQRLCKEYGLNRFKLTLGFQSLFNISVIKYYRQQVLKRAHERLLCSDDSISQAAYQFGYNNSAAFSRAFIKEFGYRPSAVKKMRFG